MSGLQGFVREEMGDDTWREIKNRAGVDRPIYSRVDNYPDSEFERIHSVLVEEYGLEASALQREFGQYLFDSLSDLYARLYFDEEWDVLELIDNVEETIHQSLKRRRDVEFTPPELETERKGDDEVVVYYSSDRHLCSLAEGLILGAGDYYDTSLAVDEPTCMKEGDDVCRLEVTRIQE